MWGKRLLCVFLVGMAQHLPAEDFTLPVAWSSLKSLRWDASRQQGVIAGGDQYIGFWFRDGLLRPQTGGPALGASDASFDPVTGDFYVVAREEGTLKFISGRDFSLKTSLPAAAPHPSLAFFHPLLKKLGSFNAPGTVTLFDSDTTAYEGLVPISDLPKRVMLAPDGRILALLPVRQELLLMAYRPFRVLMRFPLPEACKSPEDITLESLKARIWLACGADGVFHADYPALSWEADHDAGEAVSLFWDGERKALILVRSNGALLVQMGGQGAVRLWAQFPPETLIDWDPRFHRPVSATRLPTEIHLTVHTELTLE